jgi:HEAT repeat protein
MTVPDPNLGSDIKTGGGASINGSVQADGGFAGRDKIVQGDEIHGPKISTRSPQEELRDYLAAAVPSYASAQMQRVLTAQLQQNITEPYKFLDSFDLEDSNFFFGRSAAVQALHRAVSANRLTVLHAKSGAGKTSLLNAGLAPVLLRTGRLPICARPFQDPVKAIKRAVAPGSAGPWPDRLHNLSLSDFLGLVCQHMPRHVQELVLILDQFEEFFILWPLREQRQRFIDDFAGCYHDTELPVRFVLSLRKDYYSDLAEFEPQIPTIFRSQLRLDPMERTQAAEAITGPASRLGSPLTYAPDLLDAILDDLGGSGMELPHMQIICTKLFDNALSAGVNTIDLPKYETLGRARGILGDYLNDVLERFPGRGGTVAKAVLKELVSSESTKRRLPDSTLISRIKVTPLDLDDTLIRLVNARLLRRDEVEGEVVYEMAHEYLIAQIKQWIDAADLAFKQVEDLLSREVTNWRIHHTSIPRDRLELIYAQRARLGRIDDVTGECLLRSTVQSNYAVEEWLHFVAQSTIQPLLIVLGDSSLDAVDIDVRRAAAEVLGNQGDARAVESLIAALKDTYGEVRRAAAVALRQLGDAALDPLMTALLDEDVSVRAGAAEVLGQLGNAQAVGSLIATLEDANGDLTRAAAAALGKPGDAVVDPRIVAIGRRAAAAALGQLGNTQSVKPLIRTLEDTDWSVRMAAAEVLGRLGDPLAVEPLIAALKDAYGDVRRTAAEALGQLGDPLAVKPLIAALKDEDWDVRRTAAEMLGKLGDPLAVKPLIAALKDADWDVRRTAADVLGQLGNARAVKPLIIALKDPQWGVPSAAAAALGQLGDPLAVKPLIIALKDPQWGVPVAAAAALGRLGDPRAVEPLILALEDVDNDVRSAAAEALRVIGTPEALAALEASP